MGRRALRKIDPALDLSRNFRLQEELPPIAELGQLFAQPTAPLEVEVGTGKGLFLAGATRTIADHNFLGIEIAGNYAKYAGSRLAKQGTTNGLVIAGDGVKLFHEWFATDSLAAVHVYFPDPWWKSRHRRRRVMQEPLLRDIQRTLLPGGLLHFWTDVQEYFETTLALIPKVTQLIGPQPVPERSAEHHLDYHTHFERRKRLDGLPIYRSVFAKQSA